MTGRALRRWVWVHKWTGLVCTLFLLVICLSGLPLVFGEELSDWLDHSAPYAQVGANQPAMSLDGLLAIARQHYPAQVVMSVFTDDDEPQVIIGMAPSWAQYNRNHNTAHFLKFDAHTGDILKDSNTPSGMRSSILPVIVHLHADLFAGLGGELFLGLMALLFIMAIISGVILYGPFMKRLPFGVVRTGRGARLRWLDLHNLLGIALTVWMGVVGFTGVVNELSTPLFAFWQRSTAQTLLAHWQCTVPLMVSELVPLDVITRTAQTSRPDMSVMSVIFPGSPFGAPSHFLVWMKGRTPLTGRLFTPILIDARTGRVTAVVPMPWYLRALELSRPLHFGDYGGRLLKILWVFFDLGTIAILITGLLLWIGKRHTSTETRLRALGYELEEDKAPAAKPG